MNGYHICIQRFKSTDAANYSSSVQSSDKVLGDVICISLVIFFLCFAPLRVQDLFCCESVFCCFVGCLCCLWPRLTSKIGELPSQFDALVSEELRDACRAASEADKTREKKLFFSS